MWKNKNNGTIIERLDGQADGFVTITIDGVTGNVPDHQFFADWEEVKEGDVTREDHSQAEPTATGEETTAGAGE